MFITKVKGKAMKYSEIVEISDKELLERLEGERDLLMKLKLNHSISPLENPNKIKEARRNIARMLTELRQRELKNK